MLVFSKALQGYWLDKKLQLGKATIRNYGYTFNQFQQFINDKSVDEITTQDIKAYLIHVVDNRKVSKRTANTIYLVLSSFFNWASVEFGIVNPLNRIQKPKYTARKIEPFTLTEVRALLQVKQSPKLKAIQLLLLDSGLRISELCNLKIQDYDSTNGRLLVKSGKGDKDRIVYLGQRSQKLLWKLLADRDKGYIFQTRTNKPVHRNNVLKALKKLAKPLKIKANPHKYRHTFAVNFLRNGGNLKQLQEILGHTNLQTVNIYLSLAEIDLEQARTYSPVDNL